AERGVAVSSETVRRWCRTFGPAFADGVRRRRPRPGDEWHLDEVQPQINGKKPWRWRAVDQDGVVLGILVQARRNREAAEACLRRVVDGCGDRPGGVVTDKRARSPPAVRRVLPGAEHRRHKGWLIRELCGAGHTRAYQANRDGETERLVRGALGAGRTW